MVLDICTVEALIHENVENVRKVDGELDGDVEGEDPV